MNWAAIGQTAVSIYLIWATAIVVDWFVSRQRLRLRPTTRQALLDAALLLENDGAAVVAAGMRRAAQQYDDEKDTPLIILLCKVGTSVTEVSS